MPKSCPHKEFYCNDCPYFMTCIKEDDKQFFSIPFDFNYNDTSELIKHLLEDLDKEKEKLNND